jgi:hypothetical protein
MGTILAIIFGVCILVGASLFLLPALVVLGVVALILFGVFAGAEFAFWMLVAVAVIIAALVLMHLVLPLVVAALVIWGIVYVIKQFSRALG